MFSDVVHDHFLFPLPSPKGCQSVPSGTCLSQATGGRVTARSTSVRHGCVVRLQRLLEIGGKLRHPTAGVEMHMDLRSIARSLSRWRCVFVR